MSKYQFCEGCEFRSNDTCPSGYNPYDDEKCPPVKHDQIYGTRETEEDNDGKTTKTEAGVVKWLKKKRAIHIDDESSNCGHDSRCKYLRSHGHRRVDCTDYDGVCFYMGRYDYRRDKSGTGNYRGSCWNLWVDTCRVYCTSLYGASLRSRIHKFIMFERA